MSQKRDTGKFLKIVRRPTMKNIFISFKYFTYITAVFYVLIKLNRASTLVSKEALRRFLYFLYCSSSDISCHIKFIVIASSRH